eukprot:TRINITY_DN1671_c0_g1_i4.p1 TRINITY_DN1671_c0_g1~~TRINITY_DN1671_c0_g1_i4.p1  ORF type:complete len:588 (-),score=123.89 TRINITY_DN1671_c0_g1_i4:80-1843(-)
MAACFAGFSSGIALAVGSAVFGINQDRKNLKKAPSREFSADLFQLPAIEVHHVQVEKEEPEAAQHGWDSETETESAKQRENLKKAPSRELSADLFQLPAIEVHHVQVEKEEPEAAQHGWDSETETESAKQTEDSGEHTADTEDEQYQEGVVGRHKTLKQRDAVLESPNFWEQKREVDTEAEFLQAEAHMTVTETDRHQGKAVDQRAELCAHDAHQHAVNFEDQQGKVETAVELLETAVELPEKVNEAKRHIAVTDADQHQEQEAPEERGGDEEALKLDKQAIQESTRLKLAQRSNEAKEHMAEMESEQHQEKTVDRLQENGGHDAYQGAMNFVDQQGKVETAVELPEKVNEAKGHIAVTDADQHQEQEAPEERGGDEEALKLDKQAIQESTRLKLVEEYVPEMLAWRVRREEGGQAATIHVKADNLEPVSDHVPIDSVPASDFLQAGVKARICGLKVKPQLNGFEVVVEEYAPELSAWRVRLEEGGHATTIHVADNLGPMRRHRLLSDNVSATEWSGRNNGRNEKQNSEKAAEFAIGDNRCSLHSAAMKSDEIEGVSERNELGDIEDIYEQSWMDPNARRRRNSTVG